VTSGRSEACSSEQPANVGQCCSSYVVNTGELNNKSVASFRFAKSTSGIIQFELSLRKPEDMLFSSHQFSSSDIFPFPSSANSTYFFQGAMVN